MAKRKKLRVAKVKKSKSVGEGKGPEAPVKLNLAEEIGNFLVTYEEVEGKKVRKVNTENLRVLKSAVKKHGFILFEKEAVVKLLASLRLVPGNEARGIVGKLEV